MPPYPTAAPKTRKHHLPVAKGPLKWGFWNNFFKPAAASSSSSTTEATAPTTTTKNSGTTATMQFDCTPVGSKRRRCATKIFARLLRVNKAACYKFRVMDYAKEFNHREAAEHFTMKAHSRVSQWLANRKAIEKQATSKGKRKAT